MKVTGIVVFVGLLVAYGLLYRKLRRRRVGVAAVGMVYDMLNEDRRNAIDIIVEERAAARDDETADNLPPTG